jgi:hypothetical protein
MERYLCPASRIAYIFAANFAARLSGKSSAKYTSAAGQPLRLNHLSIERRNDAFGSSSLASSLAIFRHRLRR